MSNWREQWYEFSHLGVKEEQEDHLQKSLILSNRFSVILSLVFLIGVLMSFWQLRDTEVVLFFFSMAVLSAAVPFLNRQGWTGFSLLFLSTVVPVSILFEAVYAKTLQENYLDSVFYYVPRFFIISSIILPLVLLDIRERLRFWGSLAVVVICLIAYDPLHDYFNVGYARSVMGQKRPLLLLSSDGILISIFISAFVFLKSLNLRFERQVETLFEDLRYSNEILHDKQDQVQQAYNRLKSTSKELKEKNEKVMDSLRYAQSIQHTILPMEGHLREAFQDYFIIYHPKDVVSGDFYWLDVVPAAETENNLSKIFVGVIDCTGHGVPGAFMSMTGNTLLHEIIDKLHVYDTASVLKLLDKRLKTAFKDRENRHHGMDVSLCMLEEQPNGSFKVLYSGAKRPLFYYNPEDEKVHMLRGVNKSIGDRHRRKLSRSFETNELRLPKGSILYMSSDGFVDQGNTAGEKFGTPRLVNYLRTHAKLPLQQQYQELSTALKEHQGEATQRDDITLMAVQI